MAAMVLRHRLTSHPSLFSISHFARSSSNTPVSAQPAGVQNFLKAIGQGVEAHGDKLEAETETLSNFLKIRGGFLKGLGIPCQKRKLILRHIEKYRQGTWRP